MKKVILAILDGWGLNKNPKVSAIEAANTPFMDALFNEYPNSTLVTYGEEVGLPDGQMGNSEVGHLNIGAGRVVYQELARINKAIREGDFYENPVLLEGMEKAKNEGKKVHLMGLLSDGGVHSHINHVLALIDMADNVGAQTYLHAFMDGRDTAPDGGKGYLKTVLDKMEGTTCQLASVVGRYYAMDRDNRWERVKIAYDALVHANGEKSSNILQTVETRYAAGETDEFLMPIINASLQEKEGVIQPGDVVIFFNFRTDRPRQITKALTQEDFPEQGMKKLPLHFITMTEYDKTFSGLEVVYKKSNLENTLGTVLAEAGKTQLRAAETEKYPHVTFFFNGGMETPNQGESRIMAPSPKVATYDLQPEMSAIELTDEVCTFIDEHEPDFVCINFANTDMVGHTGVFDAAVKATEIVDACMQRLMNTTQPKGYEAIIIADHGNSDIMVNPDGSPHTAHTTNPVPFIVITEDKKPVDSGKLGDVAPTILKMMGVAQPKEMDGVPLI